MKVSIIIPVYNVSAYIEHSIKSVMNQTYRDIECILVNDKSTDDSVAIAEHLIADYTKPIQFRIINHEHNAGVAAARNTGVDAATGEYLYFLDSDDEITPDCIEKLSLPALNDATIDIIEGCYVVIQKDSNNVISEKKFSRPHLEFSNKKAVRDFYYSKQYINDIAVNKLIKRDFFIKNQLYFNTSLVAGEDTFWHFQSFKYISHLYTIPEITYKYLKRPNSLTTSSNKNFRTDYGFVYAEIAKNLSPTEKVQEVKHFLKGFCLFLLDGPITPVYKQVSSQFLKVLKENHCLKEWIFLKSVVMLSKFAFARNLIYKLGNFLKSLRKNKNYGCQYENINNHSHI